MRRRARRLTRTREVLLRELGALVVEMRRLGRDNPDLIARKAAELSAIDEELRGLRTGLAERQTVEQIVVAGVSGSCTRCRTLLGTDDNYCPHCGLAVAQSPAAPAPAADQAVEPAAAEPKEAPAAAAPPPPPPPAAPEPHAAAPPQP